METETINAAAIAATSDLTTDQLFVAPSAERVGSFCGACGRQLPLARGWAVGSKRGHLCAVCSRAPVCEPFLMLATRLDADAPNPRPQHPSVGFVAREALRPGQACGLCLAPLDGTADRSWFLLVVAAGAVRRALCDRCAPRDKLALIGIEPPKPPAQATTTAPAPEDPATAARRAEWDRIICQLAGALHDGGDLRSRAELLAGAIVRIRNF